MGLLTELNAEGAHDRRDHPRPRPRRTLPGHVAMRDGRIESDDRAGGAAMRDVPARAVTVARATDAVAATARRPRPRQSRLRPGDLLRVGSLGLRTRRLRSGLSALGIAIGIAAMVGGARHRPSSSQADLQARIDGARHQPAARSRPERGSVAADAALPDTAIAMIEPDRAGRGGDARSPRSTPPCAGPTSSARTSTGGISVYAADTGLLDTPAASTWPTATWLDDATRRPTRRSCSARTAADRLGITDVADGVRVDIGDQWFTVVGIIEPIELATDLDRAALIGVAAAEQHLVGDEAPRARCTCAPTRRRGRRRAGPCSRPRSTPRAPTRSR